MEEEIWFGSYKDISPVHAFITYVDGSRSGPIGHPLWNDTDDQLVRKTTSTLEYVSQTWGLSCWSCVEAVADRANEEIVGIIRSALGDGPVV